jgi:thioredoxin 1
MSNDDLEKIRLRKAEISFRFDTIPKNVINIKTEDDFNEILKNFPDKIIIIDFWAGWCAPCKLFAPTFARAHQEYSLDYIFLKINVDENPKIAEYFGISSIPTILFIKEGEILRKFVGVVNYEILKLILEKFKQ